MNPLDRFVTVIEGEPLASTEVIAKGVRVQHKNVLALVRRYAPELSGFGTVAFQTRPRRAGAHGGGDVEYAMLNEPQASALLTLMRNSEKVVAFKFKLIGEFYRMRQALGQREHSLWKQLQALIAKEVESKVRARFGSYLMHERKRDIPYYQQEHRRLETLIQPPLLQ